MRQSLRILAACRNLSGIPRSRPMKRITSSNDGQLTELLIDKQAFAVMRETRRGQPVFGGLGGTEHIPGEFKTAVRGAYTGKTAQFLAGAMLPSEQIQAERLAAAAAEGIDAVWH